MSVAWGISHGCESESDICWGREGVVPMSGIWGDRSHIYVLMHHI